MSLFSKSITQDLGKIQKLIDVNNNVCDSFCSSSSSCDSDGDGKEKKIGDTKKSDSEEVHLKSSGVRQTNQLTTQENIGMSSDAFSINQDVPG